MVARLYWSPAVEAARELFPAYPPEPIPSFLRAEWLEPLRER
jgi:hypothetical protein